MGAGGISNGELARGSDPTMIAYPARFFLQQGFNAGGETENIAADFNELGGKFAERRWTLTQGSFSLLDYFDNNPFAKDPREQFANWSFLTHGARDYAADARLHHRRGGGIPHASLVGARRADPAAAREHRPGAGQRLGPHLRRTA